MKFIEVPLVFTNTSMTGTTTISSSAMFVGDTSLYSIQAVWTGTPAGTMKLQASNDPTPAIGTIPYTVSNWSDITYSFLTLTGSAGNYLWSVDNCAYKFVRITYTNTSGSGSLAAIMVRKGS